MVWEWKNIDAIDACIWGLYNTIKKEYEKEVKEADEEFISKRNKRMKTLVKSCVRDLDNIGKNNQSPHAVSHSRVSQPTQTGAADGSSRSESRPGEWMMYTRARQSSPAWENPRLSSFWVFTVKEGVQECSPVSWVTVLNFEMIQ